MKLKSNFILRLSALMLVLSLSAVAQDAGKTKVGILELAAFRTEIGELKVKYEKLQVEFGPKQRELESMQTSLEAKQKTLQEATNLTPQQSAGLQEQIQSLQKEIARKGEDAQALAQKREQEETGAIYDKISKFLEQYCAQKGITQVLEAGKLRESALVVYAATAAFITDDFIKEYNKANPAPATAAK
ncbi:MAG: OmpH family outer membrane protein [Acidobacteria bacterium]|nr:OmpH family outer membrane protein [Acidobacteriota bacterium]MBI3425076.1 OmpH family outer membrane protein [Acidobacteriota bacterium]